MCVLGYMQLFNNNIILFPNMPFQFHFITSMGSKFVDESLKSHNEYRKKHGVPQLKQNREITAKAQKWADHLAKTGTFQHSANRDHKGGKMGENIAMKWTSSNDDFTGRQVTDQWYEEVKKYNFNRNSGSGTGHFTQIVWKDSKEFGIGKAQAKDGKWIVVANYFPAGNMIGNNAGNVFPIGGGKGSSTPTETSGGDTQDKKSKKKRKKKRKCIIM